MNSNLLLLVGVVLSFLVLGSAYLWSMTLLWGALIDFFATHIVPHVRSFFNRRKS